MKILNTLISLTVVGQYAHAKAFLSTAEYEDFWKRHGQTSNDTREQRRETSPAIAVIPHNEPPAGSDAIILSGASAISNPFPKPSKSAKSDPFLTPSNRSRASSFATTAVEEDTALRPDTVTENDFYVENNPFAFSLGQLNKLLGPKSLPANMALSGFNALERGLQSNLESGLSDDEVPNANKHEPATNGHYYSALRRLAKRRRAFSQASPYAMDPTRVTNSYMPREPRISYRGVYVPGEKQLQGEPERDLIRQPETMPISQEQLVAEFKGIYAGLVMVESRCIEVANAQSSQNGGKLNNEQWLALIALHRTLLHEHHDFFLASQHSSASPAVRRLASKFAIPAEMWRHGIHSFLELSRHRPPASLEYMLKLIYRDYSMMGLQHETVPTFEDPWIECLGDLGRYRMAIEDNEVRDREVWTSVSQLRNAKTPDKSPTAGRLHHHLAMLARPNILQQLYHNTTYISVQTPFSLAKDSAMRPSDLWFTKTDSSTWRDSESSSASVLAENLCLSDQGLQGPLMEWHDNFKRAKAQLDLFVTLTQSQAGHYAQIIRQDIVSYAQACATLSNSLLSQTSILNNCSLPTSPLLGMILHMSGATGSPTGIKTPIPNDESQSSAAPDLEWQWHLAIWLSSLTLAGLAWAFESRHAAGTKNYEAWFSIAAFLYHLAYGYKAFVEERLDSATSAGLIAIGFTAAWTFHDTRRMGTKQRQLLGLGTATVVLGLDCYLSSTVSSSNPAKSFMALLVPCIAGATFFWWACRIMGAHIAPLLN